MFFDGLKMPTSVLCRIPKGTFVPCLVSIGQVVSEENIFGRNNNKRAKNIETPTLHNELKQKFDY